MAAKNKQQEKYLGMPYHILNIPESRLRHTQKMLLAHIYSFGKRGCWQSNETIGKIFFRSPRSISLWMTRLKKAGEILWANPKGYYRTVWAKSHPEVRAATHLPYNGYDIPKRDIVSGRPISTSLRKRLRGGIEESCAPTAQKVGVPLRKTLLPTNNTTNKETTEKTIAPPSPLPAGGQASAALDERQKEKARQFESMMKNLGGKKQRGVKLSADEVNRRREQQKKALGVA